MNFVVQKGRMTADPEVKVFDNDSKICNFRIAVRRNFKNAEGEYESDFFNCTAGGHTADFVEKYGRKGRMCLVSGALRQRNYTDKDGNKRTDISIRVNDLEFEDRLEDVDGIDVSEPAMSMPRPAAAPVVGSDDDLPF